MTDEQQESSRARSAAADAHNLRIGDPGVVAINSGDSTRAAWRQELALLGGRSPLLHFIDAPGTRIELSATHPGGLAQFITGKKTLLSNLIRDDLALRAARGAAQEITAKGIELATARGIDSVHLAIGMAEWKHDGRDFRAPVLLRPLSIRRYGRDFELRLKGGPFFNPALVRALEEQFQISLDPDSFVRLAMSQGDFKPQPVIDRLRGLTTHLSWFSVQPRLLISSFAEVAPQLYRDAATLDHPVLEALAGNPAARTAVQEANGPVELVVSDQRAPATDAHLLDADPEQEQVLAQIAAGNSIVVDTVPGSGATQTVVNAIGILAAQHKRVLVVSPRRATLRSISARLSETKLDGLAVGIPTLRRDLIRAISRNEKAQRPQASEVDEALLRLRTVLLDYRAALSQKDKTLGVSALDALDELSRLALLPNPPATTARLTRGGVTALAVDRSRAAEVLRAAAQLGEFRQGPGDSPWYGAFFAGPDDASRAHRLAQELHESLLPRLVAGATELIGKTALRPVSSMAELGVYLQLLLELRDTLDRFVPDVFDRPLTELITATAPRRESLQTMSRGDRRRLRKHAGEYVRPGVHLEDLHRSLVAIQQQRMLWQRFARVGLTPEVPTGIQEVLALHREVQAALDFIGPSLDPEGTGTPLAELPFVQLQSLIERLAENSEAMDNLHERTELLAELRSLELDALLRDLADRHVAEEQVALELELAWWQSVLELLLRENRALLNANTEVVDRLEADFRLVDEAHMASNASLLAWQLAQSWKIGIVDSPGEAQILRDLLRSGDLTPTALQEHTPLLGRVLAPVWLVSPYEVPQLPPGIRFDAVLVLDAAAVTIAEAAPAIRRSVQVVAFGDPITECPSRFQIGITERLFDGNDPELQDDSALRRLGQLLPAFALRRSYRSAGQDLTDLVSRHFYEGSIDSLPWAGQYLGHTSIAFEPIVGGSAMPDPVTGTVESTDAEVDRVVKLVLEHAERTPKQSLMVITASARHAVRVEQGVLAGFAKHPELSEFLLTEHGEPFLVATLEQAVAQSRDRVIFSVGYGRTPHGRLLSSFGALAEEGGQRLLAHALTRARRSLAIVSCFGPEDIDESRMSHGILALAQVLKEASERDQEQALVDDSDPLLADLAQRLSARGLRVGLSYRDRLGLVASFGGRAAVIETDAVLLRSSLRESLRLRPHTLHRLGWHYLRVHSFELFRDPEAVAARIARTLGAVPIEELATQPIAMVPARAS